MNIESKSYCPKYGQGFIFFGINKKRIACVNRDCDWIEEVILSEGEYLCEVCEGAKFYLGYKIYKCIRCNNLGKVAWIDKIFRHDLYCLIEIQRLTKDNELLDISIETRNHT